MGNYLKSLRNERRWTHQEAADAMGVSRSHFIKLEREEREMTRQNIVKAAKAFGVKPSEVADLPSVSVVGYVGAGSEAHYYSTADDPDRTAPMPENGTETTVAVEIRGDSLGPLFNRWFVYYDERRDPPTDDLVGRLCVVGLADGRVLVKKLMRGSRRTTYHLVSGTGESPIEDADIEWAARVTGMSPQ